MFFSAEKPHALAFCTAKVNASEMNASWKKWTRENQSFEVHVVGIDAPIQIALMKRGQSSRRSKQRIARERRRGRAHEIHC